MGDRQKEMGDFHLGRGKSELMLVSCDKCGEEVEDRSIGKCGDCERDGLCEECLNDHGCETDDFGRSEND